VADRGRNGRGLHELTTWEAAIESDLTSNTKLLSYTPETYTNTDNADGNVRGRGTGLLRWLDSGRRWRGGELRGGDTGGTVTIAGACVHDIDTGVNTVSLLFPVAIGTYDRGRRREEGDVHRGGSGCSGTQHGNMAYVTECRGTIQPAWRRACRAGLQRVRKRQSIYTAVAEGYNDWPVTGWWTR